MGAFSFQKGNEHKARCHLQRAEGRILSIPRGERVGSKEAPHSQEKGQAAGRIWGAQVSAQARKRCALVLNDSCTCTCPFSLERSLPKHLVQYLL